MADRIIYASDITGGVFTGGLEADKLTLAGGGSFDFTSVTLSGYDSIIGSASGDSISLAASQLADITLIDGGPWSPGIGDNSLILHGTYLDLRNKSIVNFSSVELIGDGASVVTTDKDLALRIDALNSSNESLTLEGASFTEAELRLIHGKGIDTIRHGNGQVSVDYAPFLTRLDEARRTVPKGQSVFLDSGSNASVSDDFGDIINLSIDVRSSEASSPFQQGRVELTRTSRVSFARDPMGWDKIVAVDGIVIGKYYEQYFGHDLWFHFNYNVSDDAITQVVRALKYTNDRNYGSAATIEVSVKARDIGRRESSKTMIFDVPAASVDPDFPDRPLSRKIIGTSANDDMIGTTGNDTLVGGLGNDQLAGGLGMDGFVFNSKPGPKNIDRIIDFNVLSDTIELSRSIFKKAGKAGWLKKSAFYAGAKAHDKDDRIVYKKTTGALYYDPDGSGSAKAVQFAVLQKKLALSYMDFFLV